ncbi:hypothetical protein BJ875DRAFT_451153 [Amylocarpus encephaloides]|uniref:Small ribosomal subunit protein bS18m n=1 Tax=Amylocarpus encephaloides TaxID=45428 RepID=A0A9P7YSI5_9HELO|nr:hypothetical protein BJ875DRAFT_451153 [Amylocarpus encephaloides]
MAPLGIRCANSLRQISKNTTGFRAAFSTSRTRQAGGSIEDLSKDNSLPKSTQSTSPATANRFPATTAPAVSQENRRSDQPLQSTPEASFNPIELPGARRRSPPGDSPAKPRPNSSRAFNLANLVGKTQSQQARKQHMEKAVSQEDVGKAKLAQDLTKNITRRFREGDVYAPHDLHWVEMTKFKRMGKPAHDAFDELDLKPLDNYRNFSMISEYMTPMGRIKHSKDTGLRPVNQRRIARTIRRTIGLGIMPSVHIHPELLAKMMRRAQARMARDRGQ